MKQDLLLLVNWPGLVLLLMSLLFVCTIASAVIATVLLAMIDGYEKLRAWLHSPQGDRLVFKPIYFLKRFYRRRFTKKCMTANANGAKCCRGEVLKVQDRNQELYESLELQRKLSKFETVKEE